MNALWIIDFTESQNVVKTFYDSYWSAFLDNYKDLNYPDGKRNPWFCISTPDDLGLTVDGTDTAKTIGNKIYEAVRSADKLINPVNGMIRYEFSPKELTRIFVIVLGDIAASSTQRFFLPLATSLKYDTYQPTHWNITPNVYFYGLLYRREEVSYGNNMKPEEKIFLNQLHNIQNGWKTYDHILFFEKFANKRSEAIKDMALASVHLACEKSNETRVLSTYSGTDFNPTFLNAGVSGIYFEREVQNDREAFLLGHTLLEPFVNSKECEFYDKAAAVERAKNISTFRNDELDAKKIYDKLSAQTPNLNMSQYDVSMPINPGSTNVRKVWKCYFDKDDGYIANLKANLVNKIRLNLDTFEHDCIEKISENQLKWFKEQSEDVDNGIFGVFDDEHPAEHCSMQQAVEVARQAELLAAQKVCESAGDVCIMDDGTPIIPFTIPSQYEKIYRSINMAGEDISEQEILETLDKKLKRHPVFMFSMFSRVLLLSLVLGVAFIFIYPILSPILFVIPIVAYFIAYHHYVSKLKNLQISYICACLYTSSKKLLQHYKNAIYKSQCGIRDYCKWNREERLEMIRKCLGVIVPKKFHFEPFVDFQPLLTDNLKIKIEDKVKKVVRDEGETEETPAMSSGKFDGISLLKSVPNFNVRADALDLTSPKCVMDLTNADKMLLIHKLMKQTAYVPQQMEEVLDPAQMILKSAGSAVLMLDVSGSVCCQPQAFDDLKRAVEKLKEKFKDQVRWVAFADEAVLDKDVNNDLEEAANKCGGGTSYVPAFELLKESNKNGTIDLGKLIIISDGCPWDAEEARQKILELGCVVDVIYVGDGDVNFLRELSESTGGSLQQVQDVKNANIQTVVAEGIKTGFKLAREGEFYFGELLRKSAIKPSMKALFVFSKSNMVTNNLCIENMISDNGNSAGLKNWLVNHAKVCTLDSGVLPKGMDIHIKSSGIDQEMMWNTITPFANNFTNRYIAKYPLVTPLEKIGDPNYHPDSPDILVTQLHIQPLSGIKDLGWTFDPDNDKQIKKEDKFDDLYMSYFSPNYRFVNIYDLPI